jgi:predicted DCC family thiol-disulfide oxidoreductase YuxK
MKPPRSDRPVVLFDGVCNLCNGVVRFIVARDPAARFRFAPLQWAVGGAAGVATEAKAGASGVPSGRPSGATLEATAGAEAGAGAGAPPGAAAGAAGVATEAKAGASGAPSGRPSGATGEAAAGAAQAASEAADSIVLVEAGKRYTRSTAALRIARGLRFPWPLLYGLMLAPRPLRDAVYDWVARHRYEWFGKRAACMAPTPEVRGRFLE